MVESEEVFVNNLNSCSCEDDIASNLVVAVMTVYGKLGSPINLQEIYNYYLAKGYENFELKFSPGARTPETKAVFFNSLSVIYKFIDKNNICNNISAKVFPNGSIHLPGNRTIDSVYKATKILYDFIKDISEKAEKLSSDKTLKIISIPENFSLTDVKIGMINSNFSFESKISQERLKNIINNSQRYSLKNPEKGWRIASFQPEKYTGLNSKFLTQRFRKNNTKEQLKKKEDGQVSVFIFRSGKGTITGAKSTSDLLEAYKAITDLVRNNKKDVYIS